jgi:hypothetical protein
MPGSMERSRLHVEGRDDQHAIVNLLIRHGLDYDCKPWPAEFPEVKPSGNVEGLLDGIRIAVQLSTGRAVGFVLDADSPLLDRWQAVRDRLRGVDIDIPEQPAADGFVGLSPTYRSRVGVWLMPDNQHDGKLESFLRTLVDENDSLIEHAALATDTAKDLGAEFGKVDRIKAVLHTWLAWQKEPGRPFGTAIRAKYFRHDSEAARAFVAWFKQLYGIS